MKTHEDFYCRKGKEYGRLMITVKERCDVHEDPSAIEHLGGSGSYPIASPWCSLCWSSKKIHFLTAADEGKGRFRDLGIQFKLYGLDTHGKSPTGLCRIRVFRLVRT